LAFVIVGEYSKWKNHTLFSAIQTINIRKNCIPFFAELSESFIGIGLSPNKYTLSRCGNLRAGRSLNTIWPTKIKELHI